VSRKKREWGGGTPVFSSPGDEEERRSSPSDVRGGAPVAKTSLVHLIIIISTKDICFSFLFLTPGIYNNNNNNSLIIIIIIINIQTYRLITSFSQLPLSHWVQSMRRVAYSVLSSVATRKLADQSGDDREISLLFQRLSVLIQRYNAILLHDCYAKEEKE